VSLSDLHAEGVTDLTSYRLGVEHERERILQELKRIGSGGDFYEARWEQIKAIFELKNFTV